MIDTSTFVERLEREAAELEGLAEMHAQLANEPDHREASAGFLTAALALKAVALAAKEAE